MSFADLRDIWHYDNVFLIGSYALPLVFSVMFYKLNTFHEVR